MVEISELTKQYGSFSAVKSVSFRVEPGETFALLGPNGSGKTTILKCIAGLAFATTGSVRIGGLDLRKDPVRARAQISYLPQRFSFHENLTAREVMNYYARIRKLAPGRVDAALSESGLKLNGFLDKPVGKYSGGMVQRLGIAVALLPDAPLLILDEPAVNLDPEGAIAFRETLQSIARQGRTILFSSHRLSDVELLADRVAVLVGGRLVALESIARLRSQLTAGAKLRIALKSPDAKFVDAAISAGASEAAMMDNAIVVSCEPALRAGILSAVQTAGGVIESFSTDEASIEEMYINYVHQDDIGISPDSFDGVQQTRAPTSRN